MTQPDKWDEIAEACLFEIGRDIDMQTPIIIATALRSAYAEGERVGMMKLAYIIHAYSDDTALMKVIDNAIRAAKETKT